MQNTRNKLKRADKNAFEKVKPEKVKSNKGKNSCSIGFTTIELSVFTTTWFAAFIPAIKNRIFENSEKVKLIDRM